MIDLSRLGLSPSETAGIREASERLPAPFRLVLSEGEEAYRRDAGFDYHSFLKRLESAPVPEEAYLLFILALLPELEAKTKAAGRPKRFFDGILTDVRIKIRECRAMRGSFGTFVPGWFDRWFTLERIALSRLQFELRQYDLSFSLPGYSFNGGEMINVHIPGEGPLSREACLRDYAEAAAFFGDRFPKGPVPFHCLSWLLHPEHPAFLDPRSRILAFQKDYEIISFAERDPKDVLWRFFLIPYDGVPAHLPARNSLERAYRDRLLAGGSVGVGRGVFLWRA